MPFQPGQSGNRAGRDKGVLLLSTIKRNVRKSAIHTLGPRAPELLALTVEKALAGNDIALAACVNLLAAITSDTKQPSSCSAAVSDQQD